MGQVITEGGDGEDGRAGGMGGVESERGGVGERGGRGEGGAGARGSGVTAVSAGRRHRAYVEERPPARRRERRRGEMVQPKVSTVQPGPVFSQKVPENRAPASDRGGRVLIARRPPPAAAVLDLSLQC